MLDESRPAQPRRFVQPVVPCCPRSVRLGEGLVGVGDTQQTAVCGGIYIPISLHMYVRLYKKPTCPAAEQQHHHHTRGCMPYSRNGTQNGRSYRKGRCLPVPTG